MPATSSRYPAAAHLRIALPPSRCAGAACNLSIEFTPTAPDSGSVSGSATLQDNNLGGDYGYWTQSISLSGTATGALTSQTISFPNPGTQTYGVGSITLTATATSNLVVTYQVISGPASVSGSTLIINGAGQVTVEADQAGNTQYAAAARGAGYLYRKQGRARGDVRAGSHAHLFGQQLHRKRLDQQHRQFGADVQLCERRMRVGERGDVQLQRRGLLRSAGQRGGDDELPGGLGAADSEHRQSHGHGESEQPDADLHRCPLTPGVSTTPTGLAINWTGAPDTNAGSNPVTATVNDPNYQGSASGTFTINKATATVNLSNLTQTYTGAPLTPGVSTTPTGLAINWTGAPDTNAGNYAVTATVNDPNYQGSASGTFTINKATATVNLSNLTQTYTGLPLYPTATTVPAGLSVAWTGAPDTTVGKYAITATVNNPNYSSNTASGTFVIQQATPVINWTTPAPITYGTALSSTQLDAVATSNGVTVNGSYTYMPPAARC